MLIFILYTQEIEVVPLNFKHIILLLSIFFYMKSIQKVYNFWIVIIYFLHVIIDTFHVEGPIRK